MRVSPNMREFVLDQLSGLQGLRAQAMFGGVGLYAGEIFFGILAANRLYLKVDESTRAAYEAAGSTPFKPYPDRPTTMRYYDVPPGVLESAPTLVEWARASVAVARGAERARRSVTGTHRAKVVRGSPASARRRARRR
jgi:DNA transformation protein